ncbi:hypothetical protein ABPH35_06405 [Streptococcus sp. ZJ93]|uniref:hypothetical protein n=1 Tax=Streptococcus handemini TaxID=3161188 RepID=UPI0032EE1871
MNQWTIKVIVLTLAGMLTYHFMGSQFEGGFLWEVYATFGVAVYVLEKVSQLVNKLMKV